jgi:hypothetical protein
MLGARAFTVGQSIFFGRGEYQPYTSGGMALLAHEAAHTVQQGSTGRGAPSAHAVTGNHASADEHAADRFADAVSHGGTPAAPLQAGSAGVIHRTISFTHGNHRFATNTLGSQENATLFAINSGANRTMQWDADVTIHGVAGDPFANFEAGSLQVEREFYINVHWAEGTPNHTHRSVRPDAPLPRRDALTAGGNWYMDGAPHSTAAFAADGDVRSPMFEDSPSTGGIPFDNPVVGRAGNVGWFNYGDAFVTYLSVRDTVAGNYRHLANIYWNMSAQGRFDGGRAVGTRVTMAAPGPVNRSGVIEGVSRDFPPMVTGPIANGHDVVTDT